jgi:hypothetical protein
VKQVPELVEHRRDLVEGQERRLERISKTPQQTPHALAA